MVPELDEQTLIDVLLDPVQRDALLVAIKTAQDSELAGHYDWVAAHCQATPAQLRAVMAELDTPDQHYDRLIEELTLNLAMPDEILLHLAKQNRCVTPLAHRAGPRALLEYIARTSGDGEAITTLALDYYAADSLEAFTAFITRHQADVMLRHALPRATHLTAAQRAVVQTIMGEDAEGRPDR
jgi:hypothetical protein